MINVASNLRGSLLWVLRANAIVVVIDLIVLAVWLLLQSSNLVAPVRKDFFTVLLLLESALVFLAAGAMAMSTSIFPSKVREYFFRSKEKWSPEKHKKSEARANLYILVGILLFLESIGLTFFL